VGAIHVYRKYALALEELRVGGLEQSIVPLKDAAEKLENNSNKQDH